MQYKEFTFPGDLPLFPYLLGKIIYYYYQIKRKSPQDLVEFLKNKTTGTIRPKSGNGLVTLEKMDRMIRFFLVGKLHYSRPCFIRSCILFEQANRNDLDPKFFIGVKLQDGQLKGHSWITIGDAPYRENIDTINEYTIMMKG